MDQNFEIILIECLDALDAGEPIEGVLARYPAEAERLRPLLETATLLPALALAPTPAVQAASRRAFLNQAGKQQQARRRPVWFRGLAGLAVALVLAVILGGGVVAASSAALPGDTLYPIKRGVEQVTLAIARDRDRLAERYAQRRREEVAALLANARAAEIEFSGTIERLDDDLLEIDGLPVRLSSATRISGAPIVGRRATVVGRTEPGGVSASSVTIEPGGPALPLPTATPQLTPTAFPTLTPRPTATLAPTATPAPTAMPEPTATPEPTGTPAPTRRPALQPTASPAPIDDHGGPAPTDDHRGPGGDDHSGPAPTDDHTGPGGDDHGGPAPTDDHRGPGGDDHSGPAPTDDHRGPGGDDHSGPAPTDDHRGPGGDDHGGSDDR
jgi:hypothetical protein